MEKYFMLREKYPEFCYEGYEVYNCGGEIGLKFHFSQSDEIKFSPEWVLPFDYGQYASSENKRFIDYLVFNLGMVELVSYWKACCSPVVRVKCGSLDSWQIGWWKKLYFNGLGEFFYRNGIKTDINGFMDIVCESKEVLPRLSVMPKTSGNLIAVGGGKDSVVTLEKLSDSFEDNHCFIINAHGASVRTANAAGYGENGIVGLTRRLDKRIIELNNAGYLNGHTPFSAIVAFSSYLTAFLMKKRYIVLSNESSANESYVKGTQVNHQYSKSVEFENDFREYTSKYLAFGCEYFSLLRCWNEWRIVKEFAGHEKYFDVFCSCNLGSKSNDWHWCCNCSKCLYIYIMLTPFLAKDRVEKIFGKNLLDSEDMLCYLDGLVCDNFDKPFECIGTRQEINAALCTAVEQYDDKTKLPLLLKEYYKKYYKPQDISAVDNFFDPCNNIPQDFLTEGEK